MEIADVWARVQEDEDYTISQLQKSATQERRCLRVRCEENQKNDKQQGVEEVQHKSAETFADLALVLERERVYGHLCITAIVHVLGICKVEYLCTPSRSRIGAGCIRTTLKSRKTVSSASPGHSHPFT
jgi:hypothetical protein